jgi:(R,R)-butanediol dehydrogenase/meso-butanediol dehydrogenase/diacetyl reductase
MKAAVFKQPGTPLVIEEVNDPEPGPDDLILKVKACGICGTDLHWSQGNDPSAGWRHLAPGSVMGHEFSGEIIELGKNTRSQFRAGERVVAQPFIGCGSCSACRAGRSYRCSTVVTRASPELTGAYAEYTRIGVAETLKLPDNASFHAGALVEPLAVGLNAVKRAGLQVGDPVLVIGAGPVGLSVALWCRFFGARDVIVSDLVDARTVRCAEFGATAVIDAANEDVQARFRQIAGRPPAVVFDCVGVPGSLQLSIDQAPADAHLVVVGLCMAQDAFFPAKAIVKELHITFAFVYSKADFQFVIDMLSSERIPVDALVTSVVGLDDFPNKFEAMRTPGADLKVMLEPDSGINNL